MDGVSTATRDRWENATRMPLALLGVVYIGVYSALILTPPDPALDPLRSIVLAVFWIGFAADVVVRLALTPRGERGAWVRRNPVDLLAVALPVVRALHAVAMLQRVPFFRGGGGDAIRARTVVFLVAYALVYVWFLALATLAFERDAPGSTITSLGDAIWWACVTVFTVGYGDAVPVTLGGRIAAVLLMIGGVAIIGVSSAVIVSALAERVRRGQVSVPPAARDAAGPASTTEAAPTDRQPAAPAQEPPPPSG